MPGSMRTGKNDKGKRFREMSQETVHTYVAFCGKHIYEKYGILSEKLLPRRIYTMGLEYPEGVQGNGHVYRHGVVVMSPEDITPELVSLFPELPPDRWHHDERERTEPTGQVESPRHPFAVRI